MAFCLGRILPLSVRLVDIVAHRTRNQRERGDMAEGFNVEAYLRDGIAHVDTEIDALNAQITQLADAKQGLQGALDAHLAHGKPKRPAARRPAKPKPEPRVKVTERWVRDEILSLAVQLIADP